MQNSEFLLSQSHFLSFLLFLILLTQPYNTITENVNTTEYSTTLRFEQETSKFIVECITRFLSGCSAIVLAESEAAYYTDRSTFTSDMSTTLLHLINQNVESSQSAVTLLSGFNEAMKPKAALQRFSPACKLAISVFSTLTQQFSDSYEQITSTNYEYTRKDEDFYIFVAGSETVGTSLLHSQIVLLMRYKIVIYPKIMSSFNIKDNDLPIEEISSFSIKTVCIYCSNCSSKILNVSLSTSQEKLSLSEIFPDTTRNMEKYTLKISGPTKYLATYEMEKVNGQYRHKRGIHTLVFNIIAAKINVTYVLQPCTKFGNIPEGSTGVLLKNGTWGGCVGDVHRGVSDMALSISPDDKRFQYVHFTSALEYSYASYLTSKPRLSYSWRSIYRALDETGWFLLILSILVTSITIHLMDRCIGLYGDPLSLADNLDRLATIVLSLFGYVVGQDAPPPNSYASNVSYVAWLWYGLVIGSIYTCSLQALIVSPKLEHIPQTFSELVHSKYKWGAARAFRDGLGEQLFSSSKNPIMRTIYRKMEGDKDGIVCTMKAQQSKYACFNWEIIEQFVLQTQFADKSGNHPFQFARDMTFFASLNFITGKRELFRSHFNAFISRAFDSGFLRQTITRDWRKFRLGVVKARQEGKLVDLSPPMTQDGPRAFQLSNVLGCFWVLLCGLVVSVIGFLCEKVVSKMVVK